MPKLTMGLNLSVDGAWVSGSVADEIARVDLVSANGR
jgi:hypothetical protein